MKTSYMLLALVATAGLSGCGGQSGSGSTGYDSSLGGAGRGMAPNGTAPTVPNAATWPSEAGKPLMIQGVNVVSLTGDSGLSLGKNPFKPELAVGYKPDSVEDAFKDIQDIGFNVVRVSAFQGAEGLKFDKEGRVSGLDDSFRKNLDDLVEKAKQNKLKLYVTMSGSWMNDKTKNPFTDKKALDGYIKNAVAPLARKYKGNSAIFAFDVAHGVESEVAGEDGNGTEKGATWEQAKGFIRSAVEFVKQSDPERLVTVGSSRHGFGGLKKGTLKGLGLDFYDVQLSEDSTTLPNVKELGADRPVLIGSLGQRSKERSDEAQSKAVGALIQGAFDGGYAGYLVSNYGHKAAQDAHSLIGNDGKHRPAVATIKKLMQQNKQP